MLDRFAWGLIGSWVASFIIIIWILPPQRAHWPNEVLGVALMLMILCTYRKLLMPVWAKVSLLVLYCAWGTSLVYWQVRVTRFTNHCIEELKKGNLIITDTEGIIQQRIPFWLMGLTSLQYDGFDGWVYKTLPFVNTKGVWCGYFVLPSTEDTLDYDSFQSLPGNTDFKFLGNRILTRKQDGRDLEGAYFLFTFGEPTIDVPPLDLLLSKIKYRNKDSITHRLKIIYQIPVLFGNDTVETLILEPLPRTVYGRTIIAAESDE